MPSKESRNLSLLLKETIRGIQAYQKFSYDSTEPRLYDSSRGKAKNRDECVGLHLAPLKVMNKDLHVPAGTGTETDVFLMG